MLYNLVIDTAIKDTDSNLVIMFRDVCNINVRKYISVSLKILLSKMTRNIIIDAIIKIKLQCIISTTITARIDIIG